MPGIVDYARNTRSDEHLFLWIARNVFALFVVVVLFALFVAANNCKDNVKSVVAALRGTHCTG